MGGAWPIERGKAIEKFLAQTDYSDWKYLDEATGGFFPLVDFRKGDTLVSLKTLDTQAKTLSRRIRELTKHVGNLGSGVTVAGRKANIVLDVRISDACPGCFQELLEKASEVGVEVIVKKFP